MYTPFIDIFAIFIFVGIIPRSNYGDWFANYFIFVVIESQGKKTEAAVNTSQNMPLCKGTSRFGRQLKSPREFWRSMSHNKYGQFY